MPMVHVALVSLMNVIISRIECDQNSVRPRSGYRPHSCRNTLQGLSSSPRVLPEPASGRGRPAAAGDRRDSVRNKRSFWPNSSAAWNMTRSVFRICQTKCQTPHFMDRPSTAQQDVRQPDPPHLGDLDELDERPATRRPPGRQRTLGCSPRSSATWISESTHEGLARAKSSGSSREPAHGGRNPASLSTRGLKPSPYRVFPHGSGRYRGLGSNGTESTVSDRRQRGF